MDYDYKKKRLGKIPDEEVKQAVEKFEESKELAERSMFNFLENDVSLSCIFEWENSRIWDFLLEMQWLGRDCHRGLEQFYHL